MSYEYIGCIHLHTSSSDGAATHAEVTRIASRAGLDFLIVTDHNVLLREGEGWYGDLLLLVGEEVHDIARMPETSHYLAFEIEEDVSIHTRSPQAVINAVNAQGGYGFIAHPFEYSPPFTGEPEFDWVDWQVTAFTGLEIWNYMSEVKSHLHNLPRALLTVLFPQTAVRGPFPETLVQWDELLKKRKTAAIGGSDAHGKTYTLGPLARAVLSYEQCFKAVRTHIFTSQPFAGDLENDKRLVHDALKSGHSLLAYDGIGDASGFSFNARGGTETVGIGEDISLGDGIEFEISSPLPADLRLLKDGDVVARNKGSGLTHATQQSGVYRVEAYRTRFFRNRGWVFTNPIYVNN